jgi:hypothetical protein
MRKLSEADALTLDVSRDLKPPVSKFPRLKTLPPRRWFVISDDGKTWRQPLEEHYDPVAAGLEILFNSNDSRARLYLITLLTDSSSVTFDAPRAAGDDHFSFARGDGREGCGS